MISGFVRRCAHRVRVSTPSGSGAAVGCRCTNGDSPDSAPRCPRSDSFHTRLCRRPRLRLVCTLAASDGEARGSSNGKARLRVGGSCEAGVRWYLLPHDGRCLSAVQSAAQPCVSKRDRPPAPSPSREPRIMSDANANSQFWTRMRRVSWPGRLDGANV